MKIYSIIIIYNGLRNHWIKKCFDSLLSSTIDINIIAVDNNSNDDSVNFIRNNYPEVILIENKKNKGFGEANNQGLRFALLNGGTHFFLLNQDAFVQKDTVERLVEFSNKNPEYGVFSPIHLNGKGTALDYSFSECLTPNETPEILSDALLHKQKDLYKGRANAAAWLITYDCLEIVGGFNPTFFHYGEDSNYFHRMIFHKLKLGIVTNCYIYHDREYREKSHFDDFFEIEKRINLLEISNPNKSIAIDLLIKQTKFRLLKAYFLLDKNSITKIRRVLHFYKSIYDQVNFNNSKVRSKERFIFLND